VKINRTKQFLITDISKYLLVVLTISFCYSIVEYTLRFYSADPQLFWPLLIRAFSTVLLIYTSISILEFTVLKTQRHKKFAQIVIRRASLYTVIVVFWLFVVNGIWQQIDYHISFLSGLIRYADDVWILINLITVFLILAVTVGIIQINKLHRKGELFEYITGKYHNPREVERIFCFIDLKGSTSIAEQLGHYQFSLFLQDYYSDITDAIHASNAEVYQYVGDEIVLTWPLENGLKDNNALMFYFSMKQDIEGLKEHYLRKYKTYPKFRAGIHGGKVTVTWVGEVKKEIVFIGDVLNTAARIQEACKRLQKDYLISQELLSKFDSADEIQQTFEEEMIPRGKKKSIKICSLELIRS